MSWLRGILKIRNYVLEYGDSMNLNAAVLIAAATLTSADLVSALGCSELTGRRILNGLRPLTVREAGAISILTGVKLSVLAGES